LIRSWHYLLGFIALLLFIVLLIFMGHHHWGF
jgi:hypothetical protein